MNLENLLDGQKLFERKDQIKKVFFYKICGTGMGACACLLKEAGFEVEGADKAFYPPMSTYLEKTEIPIHQLDGFDYDYLNNFDLIVVGNSLAGSSEEARKIEQLGVPFTSFPSCIGELLLRDLHVIGVAGTHGKTTTTYFLVQLLNNLGIDTGYLVGGVLDNKPPSHLGKSTYFVIEADEYDSGYFHKISKFRLYQLSSMILTSLEFDHADIFNDVEDIINEFLAVKDDLTKHFIYSQDYGPAKQVLQGYQGASISKTPYGRTSENGPRILDSSPTGSEFEITYEKQNFTFKTNVLGEHNILNITSCLFFLLQEGFGYPELSKAVKELGMVKRRQELRGYFKKSPVIDDFAHHPQAIAETLRAIKQKYPQKEILTVFEPISATARSNAFQKEFAQSFALSQKIIVASNHVATTAKKFSELDTAKLRQDLVNQGKVAIEVGDLDSLMTGIEENLDENDVLVVLSNRTCLGLWESDFVHKIK